MLRIKFEPHESTKRRVTPAARHSDIKQAQQAGTLRAAESPAAPNGRSLLAQAALSDDLPTQIELIGQLSDAQERYFLF
ncbi:MAG TPA: hypothetical protein VFW05_02455 [Verrucomicrobiae bacterium]|nr:hypothetical protein [Verrucomicrobiae bacterium]